MNTGPKATSGFDLALTEILEDSRHYFVVEVGTERGAEILRRVPHQAAREDQQATAKQIVAKTTTPFKSIRVRSLEILYACDEALRLIDA